MAEVGIKVEGIRTLRTALRRMEGDLSDLKDANGRAAGVVAAEAERRAPRRSGRLAASVRANRAAGRATVLAGGAAVPYAGPVHWGWPAHHIDGQPFEVDAAQATEHVWLPIYEHDIARIAEKVGERARP